MLKGIELVYILIKTRQKIWKNALVFNYSYHEEIETWNEIISTSGNLTIY